ncbi:unnamed protein product [Cyclocybe aegerita]|uniref:non-specific serine/threonine protein kinase n=1 Tax=Cyclocybe aegerita TaxID=1973307 RepID=A0A8S0WF83_CYCAE|nr:unnamed protein product [Cyclocybe aegerita]
MSLFPEEHLDSPLGYFPGQLHQTLQNGRWRIIRKLGWGPRSSTWLAIDTQDADKIEAIKIFTVSATEDKSAEKERNLFQQILNGIRASIPQFEGSFEEESTKGKHMCLVFENLSPSVEALRLGNRSSRYLLLHIVKKIVADLLEILCELSDFWIVHGALIADNVLFLSASNADDIRDRIKDSPPAAVENVTTANGTVHPIVRSQPLNHGFKWNDTRSDFAFSSIYLCNFGHAYKATKSSDFKQDVWALGLMTYELITGTRLFPTLEKGAPSTVCDKFTTISKIEELLSASKNKLPEKDILQAASLISSCLTLDINKRPQACDLIGHEWVKGGMVCSCGWCLEDGI